MEFPLQELLGRKLRQIRCHSNAALIELKQLDLLVSLVGTEDQPDRGLFPRFHLVLFQPPEVELHLPLVGSLEPLELEVHGDQAAKFPVVEQEVDVEILPVDHDPLLSGNKREANSEFEDELFHLPEDGRLEILLAVRVPEAKEVKEIRIAKDQVGCQPVLIPKSSKFLGASLLGFRETQSAQKASLRPFPSACARFHCSTRHISA